MEDIYTVSNHGGEFPHQDYSFREYVYAVCNHGGKASPRISLYGI